MFEELDELARGLAENDISRRQAIRWAGYSVLGASLSSMGFAESAEALSRKARRRCRRKGGTPLEKGNCHCAYACDAPDVSRFHCQDSIACHCLKTAEGKGFCAFTTTACADPETCTRSSDCSNQGWKCVNWCCENNPVSVCLPACGAEP